MSKVYLVWNKSKTECVGFVDKADAAWTANGGSGPLGALGWPTLGEAFLDAYGDEGDDEEPLLMTEVELLP